MLDLMEHTAYPLWILSVYNVSTVYEDEEETNKT